MTDTAPTDDYPEPVRERLRLALWRLESAHVPATRGDDVVQMGIDLAGAMGALYECPPFAVVLLLLANMAAIRLATGDRT